MNKEDQPRPQPFTFTEREQLFDRISDARFRELISRDTTTLHEISLSSDNYGEFLFVTVSWHSSQGKETITFWGLGYHEYRERWLGHEWFWYRSERRSLQDKTVEREEFTELLEDRTAFVAAYIDNDTQTRRGQLFEYLADLSDDDGAITDLDEFDNWLDEE